MESCKKKQAARKAAGKRQKRAFGGSDAYICLYLSGDGLGKGLAAFGPLRRGEISALDSDHIRGNTVTVEFSMVLDENKSWVIKQPKTSGG